MKMKGQEKKAVQELTEGTSCISSRVSFATFTPRQKDGKEDSCNYHPESQRVRAATVQEGEINISRKANIIRILIIFALREILISPSWTVEALTRCDSGW